MRDFSQFQAEPGRDVPEGDTAREISNQTDQNMNNQHFELTNAVKSSGQALTQFWADDPKQLAKSLFIHGTAATVMIDTGSANVKELRSTKGAGDSSFKIPQAAALLNGARFLFKASQSSTGQVSVNIYYDATNKTINAAPLEFYTRAGEWVECVYNFQTNTFERINKPSQYDLINVSTNSNKTLSISDVQKIFTVEAGGLTFTLPQSSSVPFGTQFKVYKRNNQATITFSGIDDAAKTYVSTISAQGMFVLTAGIPSSAGDAWGVSFMPDADLLRQLVQNSGYMKRADGLIEQWGTSSGNVNSDHFTSFIIPFPNACLHVSTQPAYTAGTGDSSTVNVGGAYLKNAFLARSNLNIGYFWRAIGY